MENWELKANSKLSRKIIKKIRKIDIYALKFLLPLKKYKIFNLFSKFGNFSVCLVFILLFYLFSKLFEPFKLFWFLALYCLFIDTLIIFILKYSIKRKRYFVNITQKKLDPYSFPSGHVSRLSSFFFIFIYVYIFPLNYSKPPLYIVTILSVMFFIFMILTMLARIIKGYHYFSDCIFGFLFGLLSVFLANISFIYMLSILLKIRTM